MLCHRIFGHEVLLEYGVLGERYVSWILGEKTQKPSGIFSFCTISCNLRVTSTCRLAQQMDIQPDIVQKCDSIGLRALLDSSFALQQDRIRHGERLLLVFLKFFSDLESIEALAFPLRLRTLGKRFLRQHCAATFGFLGEKPSKSARFTARTPAVIITICERILRKTSDSKSEAVRELTERLRISIPILRHGPLRKCTAWLR